MRRIYNPGGISPSSPGGGLQSPLKATSRSQPRYHLYCGEPNYLIFTPRTKLNQGSNNTPPPPLPHRAASPARLFLPRRRGSGAVSFQDFLFVWEKPLFVREGIVPVLPREVIAQKSLLRFEFGGLGSGIAAAVLSAVYFCSRIV